MKMARDIFLTIIAAVAGMEAISTARMYSDTFSAGLFCGVALVFYARIFDRLTECGRQERPK